MSDLSCGIGDIIRQRRIARGLTQEGLADACGIHRTYVSILERGLKSPTVDVLCDVAVALGVTGSQILAGAEESRLRGAGKHR